MKPPVNKSSHIALCGHDLATNTLSIQLHKNGIVYHYADVPAEHYHGLMLAESPGKYFNKHIRGNFTFRTSESEKGTKS